MRVTQSGLLSPRQVRNGMWVVFGLAAALGLYLILVAGWFVLVIGLASIAAAVAYTGGPFPFGYYGLGDLFVFIFFGVVAVMGTVLCTGAHLEHARILVLATDGFPDHRDPGGQ